MQKKKIIKMLNPNTLSDREIDICVQISVNMCVCANICTYIDMCTSM